MKCIRKKEKEKLDKKIHAINKTRQPLRRKKHLRKVRDFNGECVSNTATYTRQFYR